MASKWRVLKNASSEVISYGWADIKAGEGETVEEYDAPQKALCDALKKPAMPKPYTDAIAKIAAAAGLTEAEVKALWPSA